MAMEEIFQEVINFNKEQVAELVQSQINKGTDISMILNEGLIAPLDDVGQRFSKGELFVPEMLRAAQAVKAGLEVLRPLMEGDDAAYKGCVVVGTVKGDLHDIGKNLVIMMLEGGGFRVIDLGVDVEIDRFIAAAKENQADIIGISALLTTTMPVMQQTVAAIWESGLEAKTIVGGAPVNQTFADEIGADGYSEDAAKASEIAIRLLNN
jgi:5-methyltetrahydrofolate--homocysteine methyltransferase